MKSSDFYVFDVGGGDFESWKGNVLWRIREGMKYFCQILEEEKLWVVTVFFITFDRMCHGKIVAKTKLGAVVTSLIFASVCQSYFRFQKSMEQGIERFRGRTIWLHRPTLGT